MRLLIFFVLMLLTISCSKIKIKDLETEFECIKKIYKVDLTNKYYSPYTPDFHTEINFKANYKFVNNSGQNFENYHIINQIELIYDNDFIRNIVLEPYQSDSILNNKSTISLKLKKLLNEDSFDLKLLIHKAKKVNFVFKIQATNSVGLDLEKGGHNIVKIDITDKWRQVEKFSKDYKFNDFSHFEYTYLKQMIEATMIYESLKKGIDENIFVVFGKIDSLTFIEDRRTYFYRNDFDNWINITKAYDSNLEFLCTNLHQDLLLNDFKINGDFENIWENWNNSRKVSLKSDLETLLLVKDYFISMESVIKNGVISTFEDYTRDRINNDFESDYYQILSLPNRKIYNYSIDEPYRNQIDGFTKKNQNYFDQIQDSTWLLVSNSLKRNETYHLIAKKYLNDALSEMRKLNK